jgi:hypothetical protein
MKQHDSGIPSHLEATFMADNLKDESGPAHEYE